MACAVSIHRAILQNIRLAQRRSLFEVLSIFAYLVAIVLAGFSLLNWTSQPYFVAGCTALWILFSLIVVTRLWWINLTNQNRTTLDIPDAWDEPADQTRVEVYETRIHDTAKAEPDCVEPLVAEPAKALNSAAIAESAAEETTSTETLIAKSNKVGTRDAKLLQYRRERLSRYRQKRTGRRAVASNLPFHRKQPRNGTSNSN